MSMSIIISLIVNLNGGHEHWLHTAYVHTARWGCSRTTIPCAPACFIFTPLQRESCTVIMAMNSFQGPPHMRIAIVVQGRSAGALILVPPSELQDTLPLSINENDFDQWK
jgi:hypothetical protein